MHGRGKESIPAFPEIPVKYIFYPCSGWAYVPFHGCSYLSRTTVVCALEARGADHYPRDKTPPREKEQEILIFLLKKDTASYMIMSCT